MGSPIGHFQQAWAGARASAAEQHANLENNHFNPVRGESPRVIQGGNDAQMKSPRPLSLKHSLLVATFGFCAGSLSGAAATASIWAGLKNTFGSGVAATASGTFEAGGEADVTNPVVEVGPIEVEVPGGGKADVEIDGTLDADVMTAVDIGAAPVLVVVTVALVFGIVVSAFSLMLYNLAIAVTNQGTAADNQKTLLENMNKANAQMNKGNADDEAIEALQNFDYAEPVRNRNVNIESPPANLEPPVEAHQEQAVS